MRASATLVALLLITLSLLGTPARADDNSDLVLAAHDLERATKHLHHLTHTLDGYSHIADDVHALARAASHFHQTAEDEVSCKHLKQDFLKLSQQYWRFAHEFHDAHEIHHNRHMRRDLAEVTEAFDRLRYAVRAYPCRRSSDVHRYPYRW